MRVLVGLVGVVLLLIAGSSLAFGEEAYTAGHLEVHHPWARPTPPNAANGAGYLVLYNTGTKAEALIGADSAVAEKVELHQHTMVQGMMSMRRVPQVDIAGGSSVEFRPGTLHVMFIGLKRPLAEGERIEVTLHFADAPSITVQFSVQQDSGAAGHPHAHDTGAGPGAGHHPTHQPHKR